MECVEGLDEVPRNRSRPTEKIFNFRSHSNNWDLIWKGEGYLSAHPLINAILNANTAGVMNLKHEWPSPVIQALLLDKLK